MKVFICISAILAVTIAGPTHYSIQNRIAGGQPAEEGQFPYQVGVQTNHLTEDNEVYSNWCGGSIISDRFILTAAHCVIGGDSSDVFIGAANLGNGNPLKIRVPKEHIMMHEEYSKNDNDIALIELPEKLTFSDRIQTVNLPRKSERDVSFEKTVGWITGWGVHGDGKSSTDELQYARRWILPDDYCRRTFGGYYHNEVQICIDGSHGISACPGDSGGPVTIIQDDGSRTVVGVASYAAGACERGYPVVYTRLTKYIDWISAKTGIALRE